MNYVVIDRTGHYIKSFKSFKEALTFCAIHGRLDWRIVKYDFSNFVSTPKQRQAVGFCEQMLNVKFTGNLNSGRDVHIFLSDYLEVARNSYKRLKAKFEADRGY